MCSTTVFGRAGSIHDRRLRKANVGTALPALVAPHATDTWTVIASIENPCGDKHRRTNAVSSEHSSRLDVVTGSAFTAFHSQGSPLVNSAASASTWRSVHTWSCAHTPQSISRG